MTEVFQIVICGQISSKSLPKWIPNSPNLFQNRIENLWKSEISLFLAELFQKLTFQNLCQKQSKIEFPILQTLPKSYRKKLFQNHDRSLPNSDVWPDLF